MFLFPSRCYLSSYHVDVPWKWYPGSQKKCVPGDVRCPPSLLALLTYFGGSDLLGRKNWTPTQTEKENKTQKIPVADRPKNENGALLDRRMQKSKNWGLPDRKRKQDPKIGGLSTPTKSEIEVLEPQEPKNEVYQTENQQKEEVCQTERHWQAEVSSKVNFCTEICSSSFCACTKADSGRNNSAAPKHCFVSVFSARLSSVWCRQTFPW